MDGDRVPVYGYRSYAEMIKQYLIYGRFYAGWLKRQGRYCFRVMYKPDPSVDNAYHYRREPIGYEMIEREERRTRTWRSDHESQNWVIRAYSDGTMLIRATKFYNLRSSATRPIYNIINYFYYRESRQADRDSESRHSRTVEVWRRKPTNPYVSQPNTNNFGRYLESKYKGA